MKIRMTIESFAQAAVTGPDGKPLTPPQRYAKIVGRVPALGAGGHAVCVFGPLPASAIESMLATLHTGLPNDLPLAQAAVAIETYGVLRERKQSGELVLLCRGVRVLSGAELALHRQAEALEETMTQAELARKAGDTAALWTIIESFAQRSGWSKAPVLDDIGPTLDSRQITRASPELGQMPSKQSVPSSVSSSHVASQALDQTQKSVVPQSASSDSLSPHTTTSESDAPPANPDDKAIKDKAPASEEKVSPVSHQAAPPHPVQRRGFGLFQKAPP